MPGLFSFNWFFVVGSSYQVIDGGIVIVGQPDKHLDGNIAGTCFVMGVGTLTDVEHLAELFL